MNKSEALLYFPVSEEDSLEDLYEQKVFEWKNFFVHRFPVTKLFTAKCVQLSFQEEAYELLSGERHVPELPVFPDEFPSNLEAAFHQFQEERNRFKALLFQAESLSQILALVGMMPKMTRGYAQVWDFPHEKLDGVVVSKEPDPMDLLEALHEAKELGVEEVSQVGHLPETHLVLQESKRLSLWLKMDDHE